MPKIDIAKVPLDTSTDYPAPFNKAVEGRAQAARARRRPHAVRRQSLHAQAGRRSSQRHWHENEDEFVYMLEGEVVLCEDGGETVLKPGDAAAWKAGVPNGHCLINRSIATRSSSRSAPAPRPSARIIPTSI